MQWIFIVEKVFDPGRANAFRREVRACKAGSQSTATADPDSEQRIGPRICNKMKSEMNSIIGNSCAYHVLIFQYMNSLFILTVFTRIVVATTIKFGKNLVRVLFEGDYYSRATTIKYSRPLLLGKTQQLSKWTPKNWGK